jgi:hypothetical protein
MIPFKRNDRAKGRLLDGSLTEEPVVAWSG